MAQLLIIILVAKDIYFQKAQTWSYSVIFGATVSG